ncbi:class I SAM-dependent methyltransferase [Flagellimonas onchidii]|uniref:class I SAM-dependent methyltransferase n=1 Tax=Flagellimonas onchidii TaxID=2562684 RepID=UPI0010A62DE6|nr:class I SAM-dependent methyltransferase [Allomuricauda onchidii]
MKLFLKTRDYSVSGEDFELLYDDNMDMLVTKPQPENLSVYYNSEVYISHTDSRATFTDRLYQWVKHFSLKKKIQLVDNQNVNGNVLLDYGAGTGDFLLKAKSKDYIVSGIEPNQKARANAAMKGLQLVKDISTLDKKSYDVITLWHVLEHLPNLEKKVEEICNLLDANGILVVAVPNYRSFDATYYGKYWAAYDVPRHLWHFSKKSIIRLFEKHDMEVLSIKPMIFDAFYVSLLSEKYKQNKLYLVNAFFIGLWSNVKAYFSKEYSSHIYIIKKRN